MTDPDQPTVGDSTEDLPDPLGTLPQSPLSEAPLTAREAELRLHIGGFVLDALDTRRSIEERENALRHALVCDPARAMGLLLVMLGGALETLERVDGDPPGTAIDELVTRAAARRTRDLLDGTDR